MMYAKRRREMSDLPAIWASEGRFLLDCGRDKWRRLWEEVYKDRVAHWTNAKGTRASLDSLIAAVYPALAKDGKTRALLAADFLWQLRAERRRQFKSSRERRLANSKNGGGTQ